LHCDCDETKIRDACETTDDTGACTGFVPELHCAIHHDGGDFSPVAQLASSGGEAANAYVPLNIGYPRSFDTDPAQNKGFPTKAGATCPVFKPQEGANEMRCHVSLTDGGVQDAGFGFLSYPQAACVDTNIDDSGNVLTDGVDSCSTYIASWCGGYDTDTFISNDMCCICGGGEENEIESD
jgi:hypothetical protein